MIGCCFLPRRGRQSRCLNVTGVQTGALPICKYLVPQPIPQLQSSFTLSQKLHVFLSELNVHCNYSNDKIAASVFTNSHPAEPIEVPLLDTEIVYYLQTGMPIPLLITTIWGQPSVFTKRGTFIALVLQESHIQRFILRKIHGLILLCQAQELMI